MTNRIKVLIFVFILSIIGAVSGTILVDNYINNLIDRMQTNVVVNIHNNTNDKIEVNHKENVIDVTINDSGNNANKIDKDQVKEHPDQVIISAESGLNIRSKPNINSDKVGAISFGETVKVKEETPEWYRIDSGYIYKKYTTYLE